MHAGIPIHTEPGDRPEQPTTDACDKRFMSVFRAFANAVALPFTLLEQKRKQVEHHARPSIGASESRSGHNSTHRKPLAFHITSIIWPRYYVHRDGARGHVSPSLKRAALVRWHQVPGFAQPGLQTEQHGISLQLCITNDQAARVLADAQM